MQEEEITVFINQITREWVTGDSLIVGRAIDEVTKEVPTIKAEKENTTTETAYVVRLGINYLYNLDAKTQSGSKVCSSGKMRGKAILDLQTTRHQNGMAVKLNDKYPYDDGIESPQGRKKGLLKKGVNYTRTYGVKKTIRQVKLELKPGSTDYAEWISRHEKSDPKEQREEAQGFVYRPLIFMLMSVYNVKIKQLKKRINLVPSQTHDHWKLYINDDASTNPAIRKCLESCQAKDDRIKVVFRQEDGHTSPATNSALEMVEGEFIVFLDNGDELPPFALYEVAEASNAYPGLDLIYSGEDRIDADGDRSDPHFRADWSPDTLMGNNYISYLGVYRTSIVKELSGFRKGYESSQDHDLVLRMTEQIPVEHIYRTDRILYHWWIIPGSTVGNGEAKSHIYGSGMRALIDVLSRRNIKGSVHPGRTSGFYEITYDVLQEDLVSAVIPAKNGYEDLRTCMDSIIEKTSYPNYEIIIADNGSADSKMQGLFAEYEHQLKDRFIVELIDVPFNYSHINNLVAGEVNDEYFPFLSNDTRVIEPDWMIAMVSHAQFGQIDCVGAKLFYPDDTAQHVGALLRIGGVAGHVSNNYDRTHCGYSDRLVIDVNCLTVTAACMMVKAADFNVVNRFDEILEVTFSDVDLCLKVYGLGRHNVYAHQAELYHFKSKSGGYEDIPEKRRRFAREVKKMQDKWPSYIAHDPFYNDSLVKERADGFSLRPG